MFFVQLSKHGRQAQNTIEPCKKHENKSLNNTEVYKTNKAKPSALHGKKEERIDSKVKIK
jgi:hypothetical protein